MTEALLTSIPSINRGLLSALLPTTFIEDFKLYKNKIVIYLIDEITNLLPCVEIFLDALSELTETQFYIEMNTLKKGVLKTYGVPELSFNSNLLFQDDSDNFTGSEY